MPVLTRHKLIPGIPVNDKGKNSTVIKWFVESYTQNLDKERMEILPGREEY